MALAIIGGEPADAGELEDARGAAREVLDLFAIPTATPIGNLRDLLERVPPVAARPTLIAHVVPSPTRPGELSFRLRLTDRSWRAFFEALEAAGFVAGDVVRIEAVR